MSSEYLCNMKLENLLDLQTYKQN